MDLLRHFRRTVESMGVLHPGDSVVIGVSGGADSLALLHLFRQSRDVLGIVPYAVHVHHGIRGAEADQDAAFVKEVTQKWGVPCRIEHVDAPRVAQENKLSLEDAARRARYGAFTLIAEDVGAKVIAVAHNADDQAETVLMHFLSGSGLAGLRGMLPASSLSEAHFLPGFAGSLSSAITRLALVRPLLDVSRSEIEAYCRDHDLHSRLDTTNLDMSYARNRLRNEIIPLLETINPSLKETLGRTAKILQSDYDWIESWIDRTWSQVKIEASEAHIQCDLTAWRNLPLALQRGLLRRAITNLAKAASEIGFDHVENALNLALKGPTGAKAILPGGVTVSLGYDTLTISCSSYVPPSADWPLLPSGTRMKMAGEGICLLPGSPWRLVLKPSDELAHPQDQWSAVLSASPPFELRTRQNGDRFYPQGAGGSQKLSDFMINAKIPAHLRDRLPLLTSKDEIVWVCGFRVDERFIVHPETKIVWLARFEKVTQA